MVLGADTNDVGARRTSLIKEIESSVDSTLDDQIIGYVYSDWTTDLDVNYCYYVGKGNRYRLNRLSRNVYHDAIMKKHGICRVIECEFTTERELLLREIELIESHGTYNFENSRGSNFTLGGEGCRGFKFSTIQREQITGRGNPMFGRRRVQTLESRRQISETKLERHPTRKAVEQLSLDFDVIAVYKSAREVERMFNYNHASISKCCLGSQKTAYGYRWRFFKEENGD